MDWGYLAVAAVCTIMGILAGYLFGYRHGDRRWR